MSAFSLSCTNEESCGQSLWVSTFKISLPTM
jgi:hypothetical protein